MFAITLSIATISALIFSLSTKGALAFGYSFIG
jgi:hypothetical protein